jgi:hypothetical protein
MTTMILDLSNAFDTSCCNWRAMASGAPMTGAMATRVSTIGAAVEASVASGVLDEPNRDELDSQPASRTARIGMLITAQ